MRTNTRVVLLALFALLASPSARGDTLPSGAQPVSGSYGVSSDPTPIPITIPEGWVFVLTDYECVGNSKIYSADDLVNPRWQAIGAYGHSFQTGLVFSEPPWVQYGNVFSFSGYLLRAK